MWYSLIFGVIGFCVILGVILYAVHKHFYQKGLEEDRSRNNQYRYERFTSIITNNHALGRAFVREAKNKVTGYVPTTYASDQAVAIRLLETIGRDLWQGEFYTASDMLREQHISLTESEEFPGHFEVCRMMEVEELIATLERSNVTLSQLMTDGYDDPVYDLWAGIGEGSLIIDLNFRDSEEDIAGLVRVFLGETELTGNGNTWQMPLSSNPEKEGFPGNLPYLERIRFVARTLTTT